MILVVPAEKQNMMAALLTGVYLRQTAEHCDAGRLLDIYRALEPGYRDMFLALANKKLFEEEKHESDC